MLLMSLCGVDPIAVSDIQQIIASLRARNLYIGHRSTVRETLRITDRLTLCTKAGFWFQVGWPDGQKISGAAVLLGQ